LIGLDVHPASTLTDRALVLLADGPQPSEAICREVMGLPVALPTVVERLVAALLGADPRVQRRADGRWVLVPAARGSPSIVDCAFAVVDVETTGGQPSGDRVIEVAVVLVQGQRRETVFDGLVNPGRPLPRQITWITRLTDADLRSAPPFEEIADGLLEALTGRVFVAHNARFDWGFIAAELKRTRGIALSGPRLCTARLARRLVPAAESCGLDWLSQYFGLENPARHRAGGDAWATAELLHRLIPLARETGASNLQELEALQHRRQGKRRTRGRRKRP
jgi:DNA polymerase-3 subunit epsilon